jgi:hypothetical protein
MMGVLFGLCDPLAQCNICNLQNRRKADHEVVAPIEAGAKADPSSINLDGPTYPMARPRPLPPASRERDASSRKRRSKTFCFGID